MAPTDESFVSGSLKSSPAEIWGDTPLMDKNRGVVNQGISGTSGFCLPDLPRRSDP